MIDFKEWLIVGFGAVGLGISIELLILLGRMI